MGNQNDVFTSNIIPLDNYRAEKKLVYCMN